MNLPPSSRPRPFAQVQLLIGTEANGIPPLVFIIANSSSNVKETSAAALWSLTARAIWNLADGSKDNQNRFMKEGIIPPLVGLLSSTDTELRMNVAGAIAVLARGHADNQATFIRCGAVTLLCATIKECAAHPGNALAVQAQEECAGAVWALAADSSANTKAAIAKAGGIGLLMNQLIGLSTERSAANASGALAALAEKNLENSKLVAHALGAALIAQSGKNSKAVRLLAATALFCNNGKMCQDILAIEQGVFASLGKGGAHMYTSIEMTLDADLADPLLPALTWPTLCFPRCLMWQCPISRRPRRTFRSRPRLPSLRSAPTTRPRRATLAPTAASPHSSSCKSIEIEPQPHNSRP